jgi:hypothetical protein
MAGCRSTMTGGPIVPQKLRSAPLPSPVRCLLPTAAPCRGSGAFSASLSMWLSAVGGMGGFGTVISRRLCRDGYRVDAGCGPGSSRKTSDSSGCVPLDSLSTPRWATSPTETRPRPRSAESRPSTGRSTSSIAAGAASPCWPLRTMLMRLLQQQAYRPLPNFR